MQEAFDSKENGKPERKREPKRRNFKKIRKENYSKNRKEIKNSVENDDAYNANYWSQGLPITYSGNQTKLDRENLVSSLYNQVINDDSAMSTKGIFCEIYIYIYIYIFENILFAMYKNVALF